MVLTALLLAVAAATASAPPGWSEFEHLGVALALPAGNERLDEQGGALILGDAVWKQFLLERSVSAPAGLLIEIAAHIGSELRYYRDDPSLTPTGDERIGGILFETLLGRDAIPTGDGEVPIIGRVLLSRTPIPGGRHLVVNLTHAGLAEAEALAAIDSVLATLEARDEALTLDEVPITSGLAGLIRVRIPVGMNRNWDRDNFFRVQTDEWPYSSLQVQTGDQPVGSERSAVERLQSHLQYLSEEYTIARQTFQGEAVVAIERASDGRLERMLVFERCLPGDQLVLLSVDVFGDLRGENGLPIPEFTLTLPEGAQACPAALLEGLHNRLSAP